MNTTDSQKQIISLKFVFFISFSLLIIFILRILGIYTNISHLKDLPEILSYLATISLPFIGTKVVSSTLHHRNHSKFYTKEFGQDKLNNILLQTDKGTYEDYTHIVTVIFNLLDKNQYHYYTNLLCKSNPDFELVWNDYNYNETRKNKSEKARLYFNRLEKYIFIKVYYAYEKYNNK